MYIYKQRNRWVVNKKIGDHWKQFGRFDTLEEAEDYRDYCLENNWSLDCILPTPKREMHNIYYSQGWCVKKQIDGEIIHFGFFKELEEAKAHRDYCEENNWDVEKCRIVRVNRGRMKEKITTKNPSNGDIVDRRIARMYGITLGEIP